MPELPKPEEAPPPSAKTITWLLILSVLFGFAVSLIFMALSALYPADSTAGKLVVRLGLLFGTVAFIGPPVFYFLQKRADFISIFRLRPISRETVIASVVMAVGLVILTDGLDRVLAPHINGFLDGTIGQLSPELRSEFIQEQLKAELQLRDWFTGLVLILAAVFAAGICEEMLVRGMFQRSLERTMSAMNAILISSAAFAIMHFNPWALIQIFLLAVLLGITAAYSRSIFPTMIIHGVNNLIAIVFINLDEETVAWYGTEHAVNPVVLIGGGICALVGVALLMKSVQSSRQS